MIVGNFVLLQSYENWFTIVHRFPITYLLGHQELLVAAWDEILNAACQRISGNQQRNNRFSLMGSWLLEKGSDGSIFYPKLWNLFRNHHVWLNISHFSLPICSILTLGYVTVYLEKAKYICHYKVTSIWASVLAKCIRFIQCCIN